jgi:hypothetical protein
MQIVVAFPMHDKRIRASFDKLIEKRVRVSDHHVYFETKTRHLSERLDHRRTHRNVGHKMSIHDVNMNSISAATLRFSDLLSQASEVSSKN